MSEPKPAAPPADRLREVFLFSYLRPYRGRFGAAMGASSVSMAFGAPFPWLAGYLMDASVPAARLPGRPEWLNGIPSRYPAGTLLVQAVLTYFTSITFQTIGEKAVAALRQQVFGRILALPMAFFGQRRVGELSSRLSNDLAQIQELFTFSVPQAIRQSMLMLTGLVAITVTSWKLSLVMASSLPPVILVSIWYGRKVRRAAREAQDSLAATATIVEETLQNIGSVKAYTNEAFEAERYGSSLAHFLAIVPGAARARAALISFIIVGIFGSIILVLWYGSRLMLSGR